MDRLKPVPQTFRIVLRDGKEWKPKAAISWEDSTELVKFWATNHVTMARFVGGSPLDNKIKIISDVKGERVTFHIQTIGTKRVARKMEIGIAAFAHEVSIAVPSANVIDQINQAAKPNKVECDDDK
jgi:hypothetical protein